MDIPERCLKLTKKGDTILFYGRGKAVEDVVVDHTFLGYPILDSGIIIYPKHFSHYHTNGHLKRLAIRKRSSYLGKKIALEKAMKAINRSTLISTLYVLLGGLFVICAQYKDNLIGVCICMAILFALFFLLAYTTK